MVIAVIGTRQPTKDTAELCRKVCRAFRDLGCELVTGNADGIDGIARDVWNEKYPERVSLILPWPNYNSQYINSKNKTIVFFDQKHWLESVDKYHPAPEHLSHSAKKLHARNFGIIEAADVVIAFPSNRPGGGGTGQGIRIAHALGKTVFSLPDHIQSLRHFWYYLRQSGR